jgi:hypothetical protein
MKAAPWRMETSEKRALKGENQHLGWVENRRNCSRANHREATVEAKLWARPKNHIGWPEAEGEAEGEAEAEV